LHENQHLGGRADQSAPRSPRFSAPLTQSTDAADVADAAQLPRLSSAQADNSASFGLFPALSRISRFRIQLVAARRAGNASAQNVLAGRLRDAGKSGKPLSFQVNLAD